MKIAHLILAHKDPDQVNRLIKSLELPEFHFFIHLDKKSNQKAFDKLLLNPRVRFIQNNIPVYWAEISQVNAIFNSLEEITRTGNYDYINLISGQDFPIKSKMDILEFFIQNRGHEFIDCPPYDENDPWWADARKRFLNYNFHGWRIPGKFRIQELFNKMMPKRKLPYAMTISGKSTWFSISAASAAYIISYVKTHPKYHRFFKYVWGSDEFFFSTILYNSEFKGSIRPNLMYVDWSEGKANPKILDKPDFEKLLKSEKLFARKFDMNMSPEVLKLLEDHISASGISG